MSMIQEFYHEPDENEELSTAVVTAVANAQGEDMPEQEGVSVRTSTRMHSTGCSMGAISR